MARVRTAPTIYVRALPNGADGAALRIDDIAARILELRYRDEERKADKLTLSFDNYNLELFDDPAFRSGMQFEASWGYPGNMTPPRLMIAQKITGSKVLSVECLAQSILMNKGGKLRTFEAMRRSDIVRQIANENGYGDEVCDIETTPVVYPHTAQNGLNDAQLLRRLANAESFEFYVDQTGFHWHRRRIGQAPARVLHYFTDPTAGDVLDFDVKNDITAKPGRARRQGRDPLEGTDIDESADDESDADRETLSPIRIIIDPETRQRRTETTRAEELAGNEEIRPTTASDAATAQREATGRFRRVQQTAIKMTMEIVGDPLLLAKSVVEVRGMGRRLSTRYYLKLVEHAVSSGGYSCSLDMVSDGDGGHSTSSTAARGLDLLNSGPPTSGRPNTAPAEEGGPPEEGEQLEAVIRIDPETRRRRTEFREGRRGGGARPGAASETDEEE